MPGLGPRQTAAATRLGIDVKEIAARLRRHVHGASRASITTERRIEQGEAGTGLILPRYIFGRARSGGVTIAMIYGELGAGKSTYAMHVAWELLTRYPVRVPTPGFRKLPRGEQYRVIMESYLVFTVEELLERIGNASWENRHPILIWDDAGVHGSSLLFFTNRKAYQALSAIIQTIRTRTAALLITAPLPGMVAKQVRSLPETLVVLVERVDGERSRALGFIQKQGPRRQYFSLAFIDVFRRRLPDDFYPVYMRKRDSYIQAGIEMWRSLVNRGRGGGG